MRKLFTLLSALLCLGLLLCLPAAAEELDYEAYLLEATDTPITWKALRAKEAAKLPVYSAPFDNAWRGANGKAAVYTGEPFMLLGTAQNGEWLWIDYDVDGESRRVGWIHAQLKDPDPYRNLFPDQTSLLRVTQETALTDDPRGAQRTVSVLQAGAQVIGLGTVSVEDGSFDGWLYVETEIDGQPAWGFLRPDAVEEIPLYHIEGDTLVIHEGVIALGEAWVEEWTEDGDVYRTFGPGWLNLGCFYFGENTPSTVRRVSFPSTLKVLGGEALVYGHREELALPPSLEDADAYGIYAMRIDRIVLPKEYAGPIFFDDHCTIGEFTVEEGNIHYKAVDGVLYTADGKTLLRYPNGKPDLHFDVPAGVEAIGSGAFYDDDMSIPLQTISLPMGLKSIGSSAFGGCGRLQNLTVPLTVTEIGAEAFYGCVSLERLSLPPGLSANTDDSGMERGDFTHFNGDNGGTVGRPRPRRSWESDADSFSANMLLIPRPGEEKVPVYTAPEGGEILSLREAGERIVITKLQGSRAGRTEFDGFAEDYRQGVYHDEWYDLACLASLPENTLFTVTDFSFAPETYRTEQGQLADPARVEYFDARYDISFLTGLCEFELSFAEPVTPAEEPESDSVEIPVKDVTLYREGPDDGRMLGYALPAEGGLTVPLADAPSGSPILTLISGEQAEVLESRDSWLRVRTARGEGWLPEANFKPVEPKAS